MALTLANPIQGSFNAGELDEHLAARTDFSKYANGLEVAENVIPLPEGGLKRRPGSRYIAELKSSSVKGRLGRFQQSDTQAYVLELGEQIMRFYRIQGQIVSEDITAAITNGTFDSDVSSWTDQSGAGSSISHDSTNNRMSLTSNGTTNAHAEQQVTNASALDHALKFTVYGAPGDAVALRVGTSSTGTEIVNDVSFGVGYHVYTFTATAADFYVQFLHGTGKTLGIDNVSLIDNSAIELDTPWTEAQIPDVNGPQSLAERYFFHPSHPTYKLTRADHDSWSLEEVAWQDGPWLENNEGLTSTTLTPAATTGLGVNVTASAVTGINDGQGFISTDVGRLVRIDNPASGINWGWGVIVSITSTTVAVVDIKRAFGATSGDVRWRLGAWSGTTGYPSTGAFYEQRLFAANTTTKKQTFWASQTGDFENHSPDSPDAVSGNWDGTVEDDDALDYTLSADNAQPIVWLSPGENTLAIGTQAGEWTPSSVGAVLTPSDIRVGQQTTHGSANIQPVRVGHIVLFVQKAKRKVREFGFSFEVDAYRAFDMTRLARHITRGGITDMAFAEEPDTLVWAVRNDGQLLSMTFRREEDVVGWARHILGGRFYGSMTQVWQADDTNETYVDETTDANDSGDADWTVFPASEAVGDYVAIGHTDPFDKIVLDYANGTAGVGGAVTWEYWSATGWEPLANVTDNTTGFTATAADNLSVSWTLPGNWKKRTISTSVPLYYVRAKITTVYTTNPILDQGYIAGDTVVESVTVIPGTNGAGQTQDSTDRDEVWITVKRTINGATKRFVEMFEGDWETGDAQEDAYFADSLLTYDGSPTASVTGFDHLEGETLKVLADGAVHPDVTVASGALALNDSYSVVQAGEGYKHKIKTLKLEAGARAGTAVGKTKQIFGVTFVVLNSHTLSYGRDSFNLTDIDFREISDAMDTAVPYFTGERFVEFDDDWEMDARMVIESDTPAPFTLLALTPEISTRDV